MRSSIQPQRRNSALYRKYEDLLLWLKFENNLDDSSYYDQQVTGFNPDVFTVAEKEIDEPTFDDTNYVVSPIDRKYTTYFHGNVIDKLILANNSNYLNRQSMKLNSRSNTHRRKRTYATNS